MAKYIIEIEEEPLTRKSCLYGEDAVYRANGFKSLVFDKNGLEKLTPYDRKAIENEVWDLAQKLGDMNQDQWISCFGVDSSFKSPSDYDYQEAKAKYKEWVKKKGQIRVGDELYSHTGRAYVIYRIDRDKDVAYGVATNWRYPLEQETFPMHEGYTPNKTGRHFNSVDKLLEEMRESDG